MSSNYQEFPSVQSPWNEETTEAGVPDSPGPTWKEWGLSALLFLVTFLCVTYAGLFYVVGESRFAAAVSQTFTSPGLLLYGLQFSVPLIFIFLAHEMGHFLACRYYGIRCTPPYFIPVPVSIVGTLGAFIKIKSPFSNKRALFDVGIAGPLAGFIVTIPILWIGISLSRTIPKNLLVPGLISFGEPFVFRLIGLFALKYHPSVHDMLAHPIAMAAWFGLLVTSLNLLPIWQLDGGHISYAVFGPKIQKTLSIAALVLLMLVGLSGWPTPSYMAFGILVFILGYRVRFYHPPIPMAREPLGPGRTLLAFLALIILILCFTPIPISFT